MWVASGEVGCEASPMISRTSQITALASLGILTACATAPVTSLEGSVTYEITSQGPFCFSRCEFLKFTALRSGEVRIERRSTNGRRTTLTERQVLHVSPARLVAFLDALAPLRPSGKLRRDSEEVCKDFTSDLSEVQVTWTGLKAADQLTFNFGCELDSTASTRDALRHAPNLLGIRSPL